MKLVLHFNKERETPGTQRYKEQTDPGEPYVIGTMYIRKNFLPSPFPAELTVTIEDGQE